MTTVDIKLITQYNGSILKASPESEYEVLADKLSVGRAEYYEALKIGVQPTAIYRMRSVEFEEAFITVDGVVYEPEFISESNIRYKILRTYQKSADWIEVTCAKVM